MEEQKKRRVDDDDDEEPRKKPSRYDDEDEDDEEEEERPRSRKKRPRYDDEDEEDEDDRPRKKRNKRRHDDDDAEDWRPRPSAGRAAFAKGKTGALLIGISFWFNLAAFGLLALYVLIAWLLVGEATSGSPSPSRGGRGGGGDGGAFLDVAVVLPGLLGLAAWLVGLVGCSFAIAGPRKARGMAITATVFASVHLLFVGVTFGNMQDGLNVARGVPGVGKIAWIFVASALPALDLFLPVIFYGSKEIEGNFVVALLAAVCEGGRLIFALLTLKALAAAAGNYRTSERSGYGVMIVSAVLGGVALFVLLVVILLREGNFKSFGTYLNLGLGTVFLMYLGYALMMLSPAIAAMTTKDACARKA